MGFSFWDLEPEVTRHAFCGFIIQLFTRFLVGGSGVWGLATGRLVGLGRWHGVFGVSKWRQ